MPRYLWIFLPLALLLATSARADRHAADSGPTILDTRPPVVIIGVPTGAEIYHGLDEHTLSWTLQETHQLSGAHSAMVTANGDTVASGLFPAADGPHDWLWTVPDLSSANAKLTVAAVDSFGNTTRVDSAPFTILLQNTGVEAGPPPMSGLTGARPNPFNPATSLDFTLASDGPVRLTVHDLRGRTVRTLMDRSLAAGRWTVRWDGRDDDGHALPAAAYLIRLRHAGRDAGARKVVLLP